MDEYRRRGLVELAAWVLPVVVIVAAAADRVHVAGALSLGLVVGVRIKGRMQAREIRYAEQRGRDQARGVLVRAREPSPSWARGLHARKRRTWP
jgi:hypothetical protein